jgi:hypothetical protein
MAVDVHLSRNGQYFEHVKYGFGVHRPELQPTLATVCGSSFSVPKNLAAGVTYRGSPEVVHAPFEHGNTQPPVIRADKASSHRESRIGYSQNETCVNTHVYGSRRVNGFWHRSGMQHE